MATPSEDFQRALFQLLMADADVMAEVAGRIHDERPVESSFPCISFGSTDTFYDEMDCISARFETVQIDCWAREGRRLRPAKRLADLVRKALRFAHNEIDLDEHALAHLEVGATRAFMDQDRLTGHGIVTVTGLIEERF